MCNGMSIVLVQYQKNEQKQNEIMFDLQAGLQMRLIRSQ